MPKQTSQQKSSAATTGQNQKNQTQPGKKMAQPKQTLKNKAQGSKPLRQQQRAKPGHGENDIDDDNINNDIDKLLNKIEVIVNENTQEIVEKKKAQGEEDSLYFTGK